VLTNHPNIKHLSQVFYHIVAEIINKMDTTPAPISASTSTPTKARSEARSPTLSMMLKEKLLAGLGAGKHGCQWLL
jgi:hypothetical protein